MNNARDLGMRTIRVEKEKLLETLIENRTKHIAEFKEATELYYEEVISKLDKKRRDIKKAGVAGILEMKTGISVQAPNNYEGDYTDAIEMLEWSIDENIDLTQNEFKQYVQDEWTWTNNFKTINSSYMAK